MESKLTMFVQGFSVCYSPLSLLKPKEQGIITRFKNSDRDVVAKLSEMGINPGVKITLEQNFPSFVVKFDLTHLVIDRETASSIYVRLINN
jgi:ferrous iron transport protein A